MHLVASQGDRFGRIQEKATVTLVTCELSDLEYEQPRLLSGPELHGSALRSSSTFERRRDKHLWLAADRDPHVLFVDPPDPLLASFGQVLSVGLHPRARDQRA
jgi:hypothetical protein